MSVAMNPLQMLNRLDAVCEKINNSTILKNYYLPIRSETSIEYI